MNTNFRIAGFVSRAVILLAVSAAIASCDSILARLDKEAAKNISASGTQEQPLPQTPVFAGTTLIKMTAPLRCASNPPGGVFEAEKTLFEWQPAGDPLVYAAIMKDQPSIRGSRIANVDQIVWVWSNSFGLTGKDGIITYSDGVAPDSTGNPVFTPEGKADTSKKAPPLEPGKFYYLVVWSRNKSLNVVKSSEARAFCVGKCPTEPPNVLLTFCRKDPDAPPQPGGGTPDAAAEAGPDDVLPPPPDADTPDALDAAIEDTGADSGPDATPDSGADTGPGDSGPADDAAADAGGSDATPDAADASTDAAVPDASDAAASDTALDDGSATGTDAALPDSGDGGPATASDAATPDR
ncbi:MAG: hypothetical protein GMKNLPBB_03205 [Myxococcota bacterium]|nr:hypothetical protein [Myxococcota bacterium]